MLGFAQQIKNGHVDELHSTFSVQFLNFFSTSMYERTQFVDCVLWYGCSLYIANENLHRGGYHWAIYFYLTERTLRTTPPLRLHLHGTRLQGHWRPWRGQAQGPLPL
jgi:hypothetical protein